VQARCVRLPAKAIDAASISPVIETHTLSRADNDLLIELKAAAVNPSDVKAATGLMPYAVFPRTPGRDYAGVVIDGPTGWIGREVFGSSGDLGIRRDGTHATHLVVEQKRWSRSRTAFHGKRRPASACPLSPRWKACAAPAFPQRARPCW
jgi:NADPH:quinone reductase-like Zn-dependent oxidoreductase